MVLCRLLLLLALGAALSACGKTGAGALANASLPTPEKPGTSVKITNPNPSKWTVTQSRANPQAPPISVFVCKPLACAGGAIIAVQTLPSPTRHPDHSALEKAAKLLPTQAKAEDIMAQAASEGDERVTSLSSKVTEIRGYPAILSETKRTTRGKARYVLQGNLFIGALLMKVSSASTTRDEAKRNFDEFVSIIQIVDYEPALPGAASPPPAATETAIAPAAR